MTITVNNQERKFDAESLCIRDMLKLLSTLSDNGIAVAVNQKVIKKVDWDKFFIKDNDTILLITATQGG